MIIVRRVGTYVGKCSPDDRPKFKQAGFVLDRKKKVWCTSDDECAMLLYEYTTKSARKRLDGITFLKDQLAKQAIAASRAEKTDAKFPCPEGEEYLPFQEAGIEFTIPRKHTLIADAPGLGKTVQAIGVSNALPEIRQILAVVPASLKLNWEREFLKWDVKSLSIGVAHTKVVQNDDKIGTHTEYVWPNTEVVIINYEMVKKFPQCKDKQWDYIICDESHMLNSNTADRTRQIFGYRKIKPLKTKRWVFLTGTPILNKPVELWPLLHSIDPEGIGRNWHTFVYRYCDAKEVPWIPKGLDTSGSSNEEELNNYLREHFMIRRLKEDVLSQLPPKVRNPVYLPADGLKNIVKKEYKTAIDNLARLEAANDGKDYDPAVLKDATDEEIKEMVSRVFDLELVSDWDSKIAERKDAASIHFESMSIVREDVALAKLKMVKAYVDNLVEADEKVIVFVVHKSVAKALFNQYGDDAVMVVGGMTPKNKQAAVDRFQTDPECKVFIGNIDAAGVGYTLTAACHVVMAELSWTPSKAEQAEDRAHRITQLGVVVVHYLLVDGSIECLMIDSLLRKQKIIAKALN
jgi:SNF2 family DNA or RNA helicase